ncbi:transmembrane protein 68-like isoform X2 [Bufo gargarizans]|nr:transmembrane protein 68-like isoform X2 [Bufo gargarizans]XP_044151648.1 transmembrane protein 68-like isoform X2 [Bufo gargarizans]
MPLRSPACALGSALKMQAYNGSCDMGPSLTYLTCLLESLLDWLELDNLEDYLNYLDYLMWVFTPLIIVFILPFIIVLLIYLSILFLHVYKRKNELKEAYSNNIWDGARKTLATLWDGHAAIWHGKNQCLLAVMTIILDAETEFTVT